MTGDRGGDGAGGMGGLAGTMMEAEEIRKLLIKIGGYTMLDPFT